MRTHLSNIQFPFKVVFILFIPISWLYNNITRTYHNISITQPDIIITILVSFIITCLSLLLVKYYQFVYPNDHILTFSSIHIIPYHIQHTQLHTFHLFIYTHIRAFHIIHNIIHIIHNMIYHTTHYILIYVYMQYKSYVSIHTYIHYSLTFLS